MSDFDIDDLIDNEIISSLDEIPVDHTEESLPESEEISDPDKSGVDTFNIEISDIDESSIDSDIFDVLPEDEDIVTGKIAAELEDISEDILSIEQEETTSDNVPTDDIQFNEMSPFEDQITQMVSSLNFQMEPTPDFSEQNKGVETPLDVFANLQKDSFNLSETQSAQSQPDDTEESSELNVDLYKDIKNYFADVHSDDSEAEDSSAVSSLYSDTTLEMTGLQPAETTEYNTLDDTDTAQHITQAPDLDISDIVELEATSDKDDTTQFEAPEIGFDLDDDIMSKMAEDTTNEIRIRRRCSQH